MIVFVAAVCAKNMGASQATSGPVEVGDSRTSVSSIENLFGVFRGVRSNATTPFPLKAFFVQAEALQLDR